MKSLEQILQQIRTGEFEFTLHAFKRSVERNISDEEIIQAGTNARLIEDYPEDKYAPSCLLLGFTDLERPLHLQVSYIGSPLVKIITLYEPDPIEWQDFSKWR